MSLKAAVVAHWKRLREDAPGVWEKDKEQPGEGDCAYCGAFKTGRKENVCRGCPIAKATGVNTCKRGPYLAAQSAWCEYRNSGWDESQRDWWVLKAGVMILFLEGLPDE